jgi:hypothetical protein
MIGIESFYMELLMRKIHYLSECQNHRCCYCGHTMIDIEKHHLPLIPLNAMTREHIEPKSYDGQTVRENLAAACCQCNEMRGNMDYVAFTNLINKWFKRDVTLRARWHNLSREERWHYKNICLRTHERQLRGLGQKYPVFAERHRHFVFHYAEKLKLRA